MAFKDDPKTQKPEITTEANQAAIIDDAIQEPKPSPDSDKRPVVNVEVASQISDPFWAYYTGKILLNPDKTLRTEGLQNTELYEDLLRDALVRSNLQTRRLAVIGKEWDVVPASEKRADQKVADFVTDVFQNFNFDAARYALLQGILTGFKVSEIMWEYSEGDVWVKEMIAKPTRRWSFGLKRELRMLTRANTFEGTPVPDRKFQVFRYMSDNGSPYGDGLGSALYWLVWFKKNALKFWMIFSEKFGSPTVVGKYPPGTTSDQQDALLSALAAIQQESAIKMPESMQVSLLEAQRSGSMNNYEMLLSFINQEITTLILGQTLTTSSGHSGRSGSGGQAAAQTHEEVREDYLKADADLLSDALNGQLIRWIVDYNFHGVRKYPKLWIRVQQEKDLKPLADRDAVIQEMGLKIPASYLYETYGIPQPEEGDEILTPLAPGQGAAPSGVKASTGGGNSAFSERKGKCLCGHHHEFAGRSNPSQEWVDQYIERILPFLMQLQENAAASVAGWLQTLSKPPTQAEFISEIKAITGDQFAKLNTDAVAPIVEDMFKWYKQTDLLSPNIEIAFGGADLRSVDFLSNLDHFYLSSFIKNPQANAELTDFLKKQYLENGDGIFGRGSAWGIQEFQDQLRQNFIKMSKGEIQRIVDTGVQRIRNWAHVHQLHDAEIKKLQIIEPGSLHQPPCDYCEAWNGQIVDVSTAYDEMMKQSKMSPRQYSEYLRHPSNAPTLENVEAHVEQGKIPPGHPFCHGYVTIAL